MFLLDTNIISELRKPRPHGAVVAWARLHSDRHYFISSITIYELQFGANSTRLQDPVKAAELDRWIDRIVSTYQVLTFGTDAARATASTMLQTSAHMFQDAMIAAIAKTNHLTVATRNTRDFGNFDVPLLNPFLYKG